MLIKGEEAEAGTKVVNRIGNQLIEEDTIDIAGVVQEENGVMTNTEKIKVKV